MKFRLRECKFTVHAVVTKVIIKAGYCYCRGSKDLLHRVMLFNFKDKIQITARNSADMVILTKHVLINEISVDTVFSYAWRLSKAHFWKHQSICINKKKKKAHKKYNSLLHVSAVQDLAVNISVDWFFFRTFSDHKLSVSNYFVNLFPQSRRIFFQIFTTMGSFTPQSDNYSDVAKRKPN